MQTKLILAIASALMLSSCATDGSDLIREVVIAGARAVQQGDLRNIQSPTPTAVVRYQEWADADLATGNRLARVAIAAGLTPGLMKFPATFQERTASGMTKTYKVYTLGGFVLVLPADAVDSRSSAIGPVVRGLRDYAQGRATYDHTFMIVRGRTAAETAFLMSSIKAQTPTPNFEISHETKAGEPPLVMIIGSGSKSVRILASK